MATTKKARKNGGTPKGGTSGSAPKKSEPVAAAEAKVDEQSKTAETRTSSAPKKKKVAAAKSWRIILIEGATYSIAGLDFVAGRPLVTTDPKIPELLQYNGRFRIEPSGGG
jgi:hypothetical protein